ncbi:MAG: Crp/Fnr family transcriptional regulator [Bacteroidales bacterium]
MESLIKKYNLLLEKAPDIFNKLITVEPVTRNTRIIEQGTYNGNIYILLDGFVRGYYIDDQGIEVNVFLSEKGFTFGVPEILFGKNFTKYNFEAITDITVASLSFKELEREAAINTIVFDFYNVMLKNIITLLVKRIELFTGESPEDRYIDLYQSRPILAKNVAQKHFAVFLGISPNSLSRIKKRMLQNRQNNLK